MIGICGDLWCLHLEGSEDQIHKRNALKDYFTNKRFVFHRLAWFLQWKFTLLLIHLIITKQSSLVKNKYMGVDYQCFLQLCSCAILRLNKYLYQSSSWLFLISIKFISTNYSLSKFTVTSLFLSQIIITKSCFQLVNCDPSD